MANIILMMKRKPIVEALMYKIRKNKEVNLIYEENYNVSKAKIYKYKPKVLLIEVPESGIYDIEYCLNLCEKNRKLNPGCNLILMCSEKDEEAIGKVIKAKAEKKIDDFVFYDVTIDYLLSKLKSL